MLNVNEDVICKVKEMLDIGLCDEAITDALCISFNELGYAMHVIEMDSNYYGNPEYGFADVRDYPEFDNAPLESAFGSDELPF